VNTIQQTNKEVNLLACQDSHNNVCHSYKLEVIITLVKLHRGVKTLLKIKINISKLYFYYQSSVMVFSV